MKERQGITGAQSAGKALDLLRLVTINHPEGIRLSEAVEMSGVDRSTAHRLLACLIEEGFVDRSEPSRRYRLGIEAMQFGLMPAAMAPLIDRFRPVVQKFAQRSGDSAFLVVQSGDHALCLHREEGAYPVNAHPMEPGARRVLGASSVGIAVLAGFRDPEVEASYGRQKSEYRQIGMTLERLRQLVDEARRLGYADAPENGTGEARSVGCAVRLSEASFAGICVTASRTRMTPQRRCEIGGALVEALRAFEARTTCFARP
jgi:DNA-binding IclR family transcriptional regulator